MAQKIKDEKQVYARLKRRWPDADWQRFENSFGSGIPDTNMCRRGFECWFECKVGKITRGRQQSRTLTPSPRMLTVSLRPRQRAWIKRRCAVGGWVYVAIAIDDAVLIVYGRDLEKVSNRDDLSTWIKLSTPLESFMADWPTK